MEIQIADIKNLSVDEIIECMETNSSKISYMKKEIDKLEKISVTKRTINTNEKITIVDAPRIIIDKDFQEEVNYYLEDIMKIEDTSTLKEDLKSSLPSKNNYKYKNILLGIKAELLKEIKQIKDILEEEQDKESLIEFKEDIDLLNKKIKLIREIETTKELEEETDEKITNNLIFTTTSSGNVRVLDEIEHIDSVYYEGFIGLINSIKDSTFKNVKRFTTINSANYGVSEVKDFKIRVVFDRIGPHDYVIISAFIKKSDNDKGYKNQLNHNVKSYKLQKEQLKNNLENTEFMTMQENIEKELFNKLLINSNSKELIK